MKTWEFDRGVMGERLGPRIRDNILVISPRQRGDNEAPGARYQGTLQLTASIWPQLVEAEGMKAAFEKLMF